MSPSQKFFISLAVIVIVWYLGLSFFPQIAGTCLDGACSLSLGEIIVSIAIPLLFAALPVVLEVVLYKERLSKALSDIGLTRFNWTGIRLAAVFLLPLLIFFPLLTLLTKNPLAVQPNWHWFFLSALLINGLAEETMMRGFVFRHLRKGRTFWRSAALSTVYFAGYHLVLIFTLGFTFGLIGVIVAIPAGFLTAFIYERGSNTIWGSGLLHAVNNGLLYIFVIPNDIQPVATSLYLLISLVGSITMLVWAFRRRYGRDETQVILEPSTSRA